MGQPWLLHLAEVDSTQAFLRRHPELGHGGVLADAQTEGMGRQGNRWESPAGAGLWLSASLPRSPLPPGLVLQRAMGAVMEALAVPGLGLKWPNDLVALQDGRLRKLGGILGEVSGGRLILGLGVNLASSPDLPRRAMAPTSMAELGFPIPSRTELAMHILQRWTNLDENHQPDFFWPERGMPLVWDGGEGVCLGWEEDGRLKVTTAEGIQRLSSGEVRGLEPKA
jgi:BirA family biotin operon repressor/biotin-[acetyl-CoA-carboxylase] ligase